MFKKKFFERMSPFALKSAYYVMEGSSKIINQEARHEKGNFRHPLRTFLLLGAASVQASALESGIVELPQLRLKYTSSADTGLAINGGQAISFSFFEGYSATTTKVCIALYLERKTASSSTWTTIASGSKTVNSSMGTYQIQATASTGYQYRVRAVYTAYAGTKSESLTSYSGIVACETSMLTENPPLFHKNLESLECLNCVH